MQHTPLPGARAVRQGDVLVREGRFGVVWRMDVAAKTVVLLPIVSRRIPYPRHRGDVLLDDLADTLVLGCGRKGMMIRTGHPIARPLAGFSYTGTVAAEMLIRLRNVLQRTADAARCEALGTLRNPEMERTFQL